MFKKSLYQNTESALALLTKEGFIKTFYLAGGTALALQLGHRRSIDLDFFSGKEFNPKAIITKLSALGDFVLEQETEGSVLGKLNDTRIDFLFYQHKLLKPVVKFLNIKLANPIDIALMKIVAIARRGSKKDFIDLFFIVQQIMSLAELFSFLPEKFKKVKYESYHLIRSLTYFIEAEKEAMPDMLEEISWKEVKDFFILEAPKLLKIN